jgi:hypothetical protein
VKMSTIIIYVICFVLGFGTEFGLNYFTPAKLAVQNVYNYTTQNTTQSTETTTMQGQVSVLINRDDKPIEYLNVNLNHVTNIVVTRSTNTNSISYTN